MLVFPFLVHTFCVLLIIFACSKVTKMFYVFSKGLFSFDIRSVVHLELILYLV